MPPADAVKTGRLLRAAADSSDATGPGALLLLRNAIFRSRTEEIFRTAAILPNPIQTMISTKLLWL